MAVFGTSPSSTNAYTTGVRKSLVGKGIGNERITSGPGGVMVDNKPFIKPERVYGGTSFTSPQAFNNAWQQYSKSLQQPAQTGFQPTGVTAGAAVGLPTGIMQQQPTPMAAPQQTGNQQIQDIIAQLTKQVTAPQQFTDVRQSPEYAAYAAQSARRQQEGIRAMQESLGQSGFGRSTTLGESAGRVAGQEQQYLESQVIPQLMGQQEAKKQQDIQNLLAILQPMQQQQQFEESTAQRQAGLTGAYLSPEANQAIQTLNALKATTEQNWQTMTPEQRIAANTEATRLRSTLQGMQVDPTLFGAGVTSAQAAQNIGRAGTPTLAGQAQTLQNKEYEIQNKLDQLKLENYPAQAKADARKIEQDLRKGDIDIQEAEYKLNQLQDPNSLYNQQLKAGLKSTLSGITSAEEKAALDWVKYDADLKAQQGEQPEQPKPTFTPTQAITQIRDRYTTTNALGKKVYTAPSLEQIFEDVADFGYTEKQERDIMRSLGLTNDKINALYDALPK